jgi:hypothetical protein
LFLIYLIDFIDCYCFLQDGVSFGIRDQARFARELLPLNFKHRNLASFVRQLHTYGFHKVASGPSANEMDFSNPHFLRGREDLFRHIKRNMSKQEETSKLESTTKVG